MKVSDLILHDSARDYVRSWSGEGARIGVTDIETFPMLSYHWRMWKQNISTLMNVEDVTLMSFAFKWLGQEDAYYRDQRGMGKRMRDDRKLLRDMHHILSNTDMIVAQNGKRFDLPQIKGRMAIQGMAPFAPVKVIDTLVHNKNEFSFSSNSLAHLSPKFSMEEKLDHKQFPGFSLWLECMQDNPAAWDECETYNLTDVTSTEDMYLKLRGWYQGHHNLGAYLDREEGHTCDKCGSGDLKKDGVRRTQVGVYQQYKCKSCGGYTRGRVLLKNREQRAHITMS